MRKVFPIIGLILVLSIILILAGCIQQETVDTINSCEGYCNQKGYDTGNCFDCVYLESVELPSECNSEKFFYEDTTWDICTEIRRKDNTQHGCLCE